MNAVSGLLAVTGRSNCSQLFAGKPRTAVADFDDDESIGATGVNVDASTASDRLERIDGQIQESLSDLAGVGQNWRQVVLYPGNDLNFAASGFRFEQPT